MRLTEFLIKRKSLQMMTFTNPSLLDISWAFIPTNFKPPILLQQDTFREKVRNFFSW